MTWGDVRGIFVIFGAGIAAIYFVFAAMFWHAYRLREDLRLSAFEIAYTKTSMVAQILNGGVGLLSILVASVVYAGPFRLGGICLSRAACLQSRCGDGADARLTSAIHRRSLSFPQGLR